MAIQHTLTDIDTLQTLAYTYLGGATRWEEIADYNHLEYPYLLTDEDQLETLFAHGYVQITRGNYTNAVTLKAGWQFMTKTNLYINGLRKYYEVTEDTTIPAGASTWSIPCRSTVPGAFGDVVAGSICEAGANTLAESNISFISITNPESFTGGQDLNVLVTGDTIYIPGSSTEITYTNINKILDIVGGTDLMLAADGDVLFDDTSSDLKGVTGADNIKYAVASRIATELGDLIVHSEYGTALDEIIGTANIANKDQLATIAILQALSYEDRITDVDVASITIANQVANVTVTYRIVATDTVDSVTVLK